MAIVLNNITSGYNLAKINANFQNIEDYINDKLLARASTGVAGEAMMERALDMNGNKILNVFVDVNDANSLLTVGVADSRYYNVSGDTLTGPMNANGQIINNLPTPSSSSQAATKAYVDAVASTEDSNNKKSLRFPDVVDVMADVPTRANSLQGYNNVGKPVPIFSYTDTADLALKLAGTNGTSYIGLQSGTLKNALVWITPEMYGAVGDGVTDDTAAMQAAINACQYKTLILSNGKKYRTKNLTVPHPMTFRGLGRRQEGAIVPYGNVPSEGFVHSGTLLYITTSGTVSFYDVTIDARNITLSFVDGQRLTGVVAQDNTSGVYQSGFMMFNCNVSGFSGNNIYGGARKSFGILMDCQSESSGRSCIRIDGVDWRIDHCYVGRSLENYGIEVLGENNAITNCDVYFNARSGIFYSQTTGKVFIKVHSCTINSNGQHGISVSGPYMQPAGTSIIGNIFWNNSTELTGTYHNIDLSYGRGHITQGNNHDAYQASSGSSSARCGYCINLRNGATLAACTDTYDPNYSYINGFINVDSQSSFTWSLYKVGSMTDFTKQISNDTKIGYSVKLDAETFNRVEVGAGNIKLGNGSASPTHGITTSAAFPGTTVGIQHLGVVGAYDTSHLRVGTHRIWSGGDSTIRTNTSSPSSATDGNIITSMRTAVPATSTSSGVVGQWAADASYFYYCYASNSWRRIAGTTF